MVWCRSGDKPLSEPMMVSLLTHICVIRPQWVKLLSISSITWVPQIFRLIKTVHVIGTKHPTHYEATVPWSWISRRGLGSSYYHGWTLFPACISNHRPYKVWDKITYPFPNLFPLTHLNTFFSKKSRWRWSLNEESYPIIYLDVIMYSCNDSNAETANHCGNKRPYSVTVAITLIVVICRQCISNYRKWPTGASFYCRLDNGSGKYWEVIN